MAGPYLLPEDVSAEHARQVLDFLNQAESAEAIAAAVELPRELDVGMGVARRILQRRAELNGFTTLDQVYAVPFVGPERFTEIVMSLSGARPPRGAAAAAHQELAELRRDLETLRAALQPAARARIWTVQDTIWFGQTATVLVQVHDSRGRPMIGQPLTVTTSWGELTVRDAAAPFWAGTAAARTNDVGLAELRLRARFQAPLSDAQRLALELAARVLPPEAPWPTAAPAELMELVQRYRSPGSDGLREAIDAAFREYGRSVTQAEHRGQALAEWDQIPVSLVCFVHDGADERGREHLALGTYTPLVRNWLPAFLTTFEGAVGADRRLSAELQRAPRDSADPDVFLRDVFVSVQAFVKTERGELGQSIRTRAAEAELQQFLQTSVAALPEEARIPALSGVRDASATIGSGGLPVFTAVETFRRESTAKLDLSTGLLSERLGTLEATAVTTEQMDTLRTQILEQTRAELTTVVGDTQLALTSEVQRLAERQAQLTQQIGLKADATLVQALQAETVTLRQAIDTKADRSALDALVRTDADFGRQLDRLTATTTTLRNDVSGLSTTVTGLNTRISRDLERVGSRIGDIENRLRP